MQCVDYLRKATVKNLKLLRTFDNEHEMEILHCQQLKH